MASPPQKILDGERDTYTYLDLDNLKGARREVAVVYSDARTMERQVILPMEVGKVSKSVRE